MMKKPSILLITMIIAVVFQHTVKAQQVYKNNDFMIIKTVVKHHNDLQMTSWSITVTGNAGSTLPKPAGQLDGAPVLGYVFPTSLKTTDVGFNATEGIVALALTSHPDFDDTPLWDENNDSVFNNDGIIWHPHWVILVPDDRVPGGLSVKQFDPEDQQVSLPPTNPGMPMYMDSPGFQVITHGNTIQVTIPDYRLNHNLSFNYDGVAAYMQVNTSIKDKPLLGVYDVYSVMSGDLSLPYTVKK